MSGGSSSGSAAAVAAGLCHAALGTDTSGSIRLPAALCGVIGMKPTYNLISSNGVFPLSQTLDHVGVLTRTVRDNALILETLSGSAGGTFSAKLNCSINGLTVGIPTAFYHEYLSAEVASTLLEARKLFESVGATVIDVDIPEIWDIYAAQQLILKAEAYANHQHALEEGAPYDPEVRSRLMTGAEVNESTYRDALEMQASARKAFDSALTSANVLLTATCGIVAPKLGERKTELNGQVYPTPWLLTRLTAPTNLSGHPCISVPFRSSKGLPIGIQLIGRTFDEATVYQFAATLEAERTRSHNRGHQTAETV